MGLSFGENVCNWIPPTQAVNSGTSEFYYETSNQPEPTVKPLDLLNSSTHLTIDNQNII